MAWSRRARRRLTAGAAVLLVIVAATVIWFHFSVEPGAAVIRRLFEHGSMVHAGPGVPTERDTVASHRVTVPVAGEPDAHLDIYAPTTPPAEPVPVVLLIHGGGYIANGSASVAGYAEILADSGYVVASLDYALAPHTHYPAPVVQANAAFGWLREHAAESGGDASRMFVAGDSAGAQIASQVAAVETDDDFAARVGVTRALEPGELRGAVLFCGLYDMSTVAGTHFPGLSTFMWAYTGHRDWKHAPRIGELSTVDTATSAYPPTFIAVGDADPFASQGKELAAALRDRDVEVETEFWQNQGLGHEYQYDFRLPQARTTLTDTLAFLARHAA